MLKRRGFLTWKLMQLLFHLFLVKQWTLAYQSFKFSVDLNAMDVRWMLKRSVFLLGSYIFVSFVACETLR